MTQEKCTIAYPNFKSTLSSIPENTAKQVFLSVKVPSKNLAFQIPSGTMLNISSIKFNLTEDLMCLVFMVEQGSNPTPMSVAEMQGIIRDIDSYLAQNLGVIDPNQLNIMLTSDGKIYAPYEASGSQTPQGSLEIVLSCEELGPMLGQ